MSNILTVVFALSGRVMTFQADLKRCRDSYVNINQIYPACHGLVPIIGL